jgi:hypothetical protein
MNSIFVLAGTSLLIFGGVLTARSKNRSVEVEKECEKTNKFKEWIFFKLIDSDLYYYAFNPITGQFIEVVNIMDRFGINVRNSGTLRADAIIRDYFNECRLNHFRIYSKSTEANFVHAFNSVSIEVTKSFEPILNKHFNS